MTERSLWDLAAYKNGRGFTADERSQSGTPLIRIRQLLDPSAEVDYYDGSIDQQHMINTGDLIFSWSATLVAAIWDRGSAALNQHLFRVDPYPGTDKRWLRWRLQASIPHFLGWMHGSAMTHLTTDMLRAMRVDVPTLMEQQRIAGFLDAEVARIDQLIALRGRTASLAIERGHAIRDAALDAAIDLQGEMPLRRLSLGVTQGSSPQCDNTPAAGQEWGVLKLSAIKRGLFRESENKRLPQGVRPVRKHRVKSGDLLITRANTPDLVGDAAIVTDHVENLLLPDLIYRLNLARDANPHFILQCILGTRTRQLIQAVARGSSSSMVKLRGEDILSWPIPALSPEQQRMLITRISDETKRLADIPPLMQRQIDLLEERRQSLIEAAVSGQLDVTTARGADVS